MPLCSVASKLEQAVYSWWKRSLKRKEPGKSPSEKQPSPHTQGREVAGLLGTGDQWIKLVKEREAWVLDKRQNQKPNEECRQSSKFGVGGCRLSFGLGEFEMGSMGRLL